MNIQTLRPKKQEPERVVSSFKLLILAQDADKIMQKRILYFYLQKLQTFKSLLTKSKIRVKIR
ncbi:hypothetical protein A3J41_03470 [candidate division TM6 bacterium RIFCSPHIGHO2_12_FULL_38_8]|nr:MAG: hypothetical protein A3J41_03470 [candidate division TM6 bacterium RIFCSPHIGHO2_12_FULL_38_8]